MNAAQGVKTPVASALFGILWTTCVGGIRAPLQPAQFQFSSPQYQITADVRGLLCSVSEVPFPFNQRAT